MLYVYYIAAHKLDELHYNYWLPISCRFLQHLRKYNVWQFFYHLNKSNYLYHNKENEMLKTNYTVIMTVCNTNMATLDGKYSNIFVLYTILTYHSKCSKIVHVRLPTAPRKRN